MSHFLIPLLAVFSQILFLLKLTKTTLRFGAESHPLPATILLHRTESDYWTRKTCYFLDSFNYWELLVCKISKLKQCSKVSVENDLFTHRPTRLQFQTKRAMLS